MTRLVWFRTDLRLHDNETLSSAVRAGDPVAFVYIHDDSSPLSGFRKQILAESLRSLSEGLRDLGSELLCLSGRPQEVLPRLCTQLGVNEVYFSRLTAFDERKTEDAVTQSLAALGVATRRFQTHTLFCDEDAQGFELYRPMSFSKLRKLIEQRSWPIRPPLAAPENLPECPQIGTGSGFIHFDFKLWLAQAEPGLGFSCEGGERAALDFLTKYMGGGHLRTYKQTRNGLLEWTDSSKFSPYLALGCLSARLIYREVRAFEAAHGENLSTVWFLYELLWRDHFHFMAQVRGRELFTDSGRPKMELARGPAADKSFAAWRSGETGRPFIDAAMKELRLTGWLSNRMRQNAASFFVHDLGLDWREGAAWFEQNLIDYDPASNWGNWAYIAGAGFDHNPHSFDIEQQANMFDPDGAYRARW